MTIEQPTQTEPENNFETISSYLESIPLYQDKISQLLAHTRWKKNETLKRVNETRALIKLVENHKERITPLQKDLLMNLQIIEKTVFTLIKKITTKPNSSVLSQEVPINSDHTVLISAEKYKAGVKFSISLNSKSQEQSTYLQKIGENPREMPAGELVFRQVRALTDYSHINFYSQIFSRESEIIQPTWKGIPTLLMWISHRLNRVAIEALRKNNQVCWATIVDHSENSWSENRANEIGFIQGSEATFVKNIDSEKVYATSSDKLVNYTVRSTPINRNTYTYYY